MGFGIIRVEKIKAVDNGEVFGRAKHNLREGRSPDNVIEEKSYLNHIEGAKSAKEVWDKMREIHETVNVKIRPDAVGLLEVMITSSSDLPEKFNHKDYLESGREFVKNMYGAENVLNVSIHYDESVPHLHAFVVPIETKIKTYRDGSKAKKRSLSCQKYMGDKVKLHNFQEKFFSEVSSKFSLERGIEAEISRSKHKASTLYKEGKRQAEKALKLDTKETELWEKDLNVNLKEESLSDTKQYLEIKKGELKMKMEELEEKEKALDKREMVISAKEKMYDRIEKAVATNTLNDVDKANSYDTVKRSNLRLQEDLQISNWSSLTLDDVKNFPLDRIKRLNMRMMIDQDKGAVFNQNQYEVYKFTKQVIIKNHQQLKLRTH